MSALQSLAGEDSFTISPTARSAAETSRHLAEWCIDVQNEQSLTQFLTTLFGRLKNCLPKKKTKKFMEKMWGSFHRERCSAEYKALWTTFLTNSVNESAQPIFYQHLTDIIFKDIIKNEYPVKESNTIRKEALTYEERNVLRYVGGYMGLEEEA